MEFVNKVCKDKKKDGYPFSLSLYYYTCPSTRKAQNTRRSLVKIPLHLCSMRYSFDIKYFLKNNLHLGSRCFHQPHLEDYWADRLDDFEVQKRDCSKMTIQQIK